MCNSTQKVFNFSRKLRENESKKIVRDPVILNWHNIHFFLVLFEVVPLNLFLIWFNWIITCLFHTVNSKNISRSNAIFQYTDVVMNEIDLLLKFPLRSFSYFKMLKESLMWYTPPSYFFCWLISIVLVYWFLRISQFLQWYREL